MKHNQSSKVRIGKKQKKDARLKVQTLFKKTESSAEKLNKDEDSH